MTDFDTAAVKRQSADERIAHRGPIRRLLVSPEIGALIGALIVWAFFWGNGDTFGTAGSTANWLDVAAPLGIMAVAVAMLMIGGEFDLSAGVMTGAAGVLVALMAKYFLGDGVTFWLCIPAVFLMAGMVGWWNGTLVNRTGLPSFIVTLGTFFVIKGANLVFAKRINDKVNVSDIQSTHGYAFFKAVFAGERQFDTFGARDGIFVVCGLIALVFVVVGLLEQSFIRDPDGSRVGLLVAAVGLIAAIGGVLVLHRTDGTGGNLAAAVLAGGGLITVVLGVCAARYRRSVRLHGAADSTVIKAVALGVVFIGLSCVAGLLFDRNERQVILSWVPSGLRPVIGVVAVLVGFGLGLRAAWPIIRRRTSIVASLGGTLLMPLLGLVVLVLVLAFLQLTTVQALRTIVTMVAGTVGFVLLLQARSMASKVSTSWFIGIGVLIAVALVVVAFVVRGDSEAARFRTGIFTVLVASGVLLLANTFAEASYEKRTFVDTAADALGRRAALIGLIIGAIGLATRLLFSGAVFRMSVFWWLFATAIGAFVLTRTRYGNWIFSVGGNKEAARAIGVPANAVKTSLFVTTSLAGAFVGVMTLMRLNSVQAQQGDGQEFEFIIAAVVGGNLLTGGYGSVVGASLGAAIMAISKNGIPAAKWNQDGRYIFLGAVLLLAVLVNNYIRRKAQEAR